MKLTPAHHERIAALSYAQVYECYCQKVEKKGRTVAELGEVLRWMTGYDDTELVAHREAGSTLRELFAGADVHPNSRLVTGVICGCRVEEIDNELTRRVRCLDKLVDELARGRPMEKILRQEG